MAGITQAPPDEDSDSEDDMTVEGSSFARARGTTSPGSSPPFPSLLISRGVALPPFVLYKGFPSPRDTDLSLHCPGSFPRFAVLAGAPPPPRLLARSELRGAFASKCSPRLVL